MTTHPTIKASDYVLEAARTAHRTDPEYFLIGLTGEIGELCSCPKEEVKNETGDVLWYHTGLLGSLEAKYPGSVGNVFLEEFGARPTFWCTGVDALLDLRTDLMLQVCKVNELYKKLIGHNKPVLADLVRELRAILPLLAKYGSLHYFSLSEAAAANVAKLRKRYPDGFSFEASAKRADEL